MLNVINNDDSVGEVEQFQCNFASHIGLLHLHALSALLITSSIPNLQFFNKRGQKTPMKPTAPTRKLWSEYSVAHSRPKTPKMAKIRLFDRTRILLSVARR